LPSACHFDNFMGDVVHGTIGVDANKAGDASHPFPLVGGIAARADHERLERLLLRKLGDVAKAERLDGGGRDRFGKRGSSLVDDTGGEHGPGSLLDPFGQNVARNIKAEDQRRAARLGGPQPVGGRSQRGAEVRIWNPDGSTAELSGNGVRIVAAWLARRSGSERVAISVGSRELEAVIGADGDIALDVGQVDVGETERLDLGDERVEFTPVSVGNPHAVVRREPERGELLRLGPRIERHSRFPDRTNVQLVRVDGTHDLTVGVWERGAGETLSSGTSSVAAAAAAVANGWCESPVHVHLPGGDLLVELDADGRARLTGPAEEICRVELL
jgi:diaminopimelate epimerase